MKICLAGEGAQGISHADVLQDIEGVEIDTLAGGIAADAEAFASERGIPHWSLDLEECLSRDGVEAVILTTPNQVHCAQAELALNMGKHVLVEIPMGISLAESQRIAELEERTGLVCMVCHTQRYNSAFREVYRQVQEGELTLHGITKKVDLEIKAFKCRLHPFKLKQVCGADARGNIMRDDFGISYAKMLGFKMDVALRISVEAIKN